MGSAPAPVPAATVADVAPKLDERPALRNSTRFDGTATLGPATCLDGLATLGIAPVLAATRGIAAVDDPAALGRPGITTAADDAAAMAPGAMAAPCPAATGLRVTAAALSPAGVTTPAASRPVDRSGADRLTTDGIARPTTLGGRGNATNRSAPGVADELAWPPIKPGGNAEAGVPGKALALESAGALAIGSGSCVASETR
jgi:hypothetical protein